MYKKFFVMILVSFFIMYLAMFLNLDRADHYYTSTTRIYMSLLMVSPMVVLMLSMMGGMYPDKRLNRGIIAGAVVVFIMALAGLRTQTPIGDVQYMKAMIPHHSSAIMVSKHTHLEDPEVIRLSKQIIQSQEKEIAEMKLMIDRLNK